MKLRAAAAVALIGALAAVVLLTRAGEDAALIGELEATGACEYDTVTDGDPPAGGDPDSDPAEPGFYRPGDPVPSDAALVRAMRQGFVVLWYAPGNGADRYQDLSDRFGRDLIVVPRDGLGHELVVTSWQRRLACARLDGAAVARFTEAFRDQGPEKGFL